VQIVEGAAKMYGVQYDIKKAGETVSAPMDREMIDLVAETARQIPEVKTVIRQRQGTGGGEDCTFFMLRVQERGGKATIANIGTVGPAVGHNSYYDIDEDSLVTGVKLVSMVALNALGRGRVR
jgi:aminobenzoyl-glutamate utilization protein A